MRHRLVRSPSGIEDIVSAWRREMPDVTLDPFLFGIYAQRLHHMYGQSAEAISKARFGLRLDDMRVLLALRRAPATDYARRPTDLAQSMLVTPGAITKKVVRLTAKRFVRRIPDGGAYLVQLTARGRSVAEKFVVAACRDSAFAAALAALPPKERAAGARFCRKLIAILEKESSPPAARPPTARQRAKRSRTQ